MQSVSRHRIATQQHPQILSPGIRSRRARGFSLIELVIVVVIIGIIGAIAIPRMSRGAAGAADSALTANLAVLRNALDLYAAEHNGEFPTLANLNADGITTANALINFSDVNGNVSLTTSSTHIFGPYLRGIPALPVGSNKGETGFTATLGDADAGWVYDQATGTVTANATESDAGGTAYSNY